MNIASSSDCLPINRLIKHSPTPNYKTGLAGVGKNQPSANQD